MSSLYVIRGEIKREKRRWLVSASIAIAALIVYASFLSKSLDDFDSYNFVWAIHHYDPLNGIPHPPGYFLYIITGKLISLITGSARSALIAVSVISSVLVISLVFYANSMAFGEIIALISVFIIIYLPVMWLTSEKVLSDTFGLLVQSVFLLSLYKNIRGNWPYWATSLVLAIGAGIRPQNIAGPAIALVFTMVVHRESLKTFAVSTVSAIIAFLSWFLPFSRYFAWDMRKVLDYVAGPLIFITKTESVAASSSFLSELPHRFAHIWDYSSNFLCGIASPGMRGVICVFVIVLVFYGAFATKNKAFTIPLLLWFLFDGSLYVLFLNTENVRYMLSFVIPYATLIACSLYYIAGKRVSLLLSLAFLLFNVVRVSPIAYDLHTVPSPPDNLAAYIKGYFPRDDTIVVARQSYNALKYYLSNYTVLFADYFGDEGLHKEILKRRPKFIVIADPEAFLPGNEYVEVEHLVFHRNPFIHAKHSRVVANVYVLAKYIRKGDLLLPKGGVIRLGTREDGKYIVSGWYRRENIGGVYARWMGKEEKAVIRVMLPDNVTSMSLRAISFHTEQDVEFWCNGIFVGHKIVYPYWTNISLRLPKNCVGNGEVSYIEIVAHSRKSPAELGVSTDKRKLAVAVAEVRFDAK